MSHPHEQHHPPSRCPCCPALLPPRVSPPAGPAAPPRSAGTPAALCRPGTAGGRREGCEGFVLMFPLRYINVKLGVCISAGKREPGRFSAACQAGRGRRQALQATRQGSQTGRQCSGAPSAPHLVCDYVWLQHALSQHSGPEQQLAHAGAEPPARGCGSRQGAALEEVGRCLWPPCRLQGWACGAVCRQTIVGLAESACQIPHNRA